MTTPTPIKFKSYDQVIKNAENAAENANELLNPFASDKSKIGKIPFYSTGARALLKIGGKDLQVARSISWTIASVAEPIYTIDTPLPWDIDVGSTRITAQLSQIMDPTAGPEVNHLSNIMPALVHQPMVEMQVLDKFGTSLFFARGMFTNITGSISMGQTGAWSAGFTGVLYQHYVNQTGYEPYSVVGKSAGLLNNVVNSISNLSGGIL